MVISQVAVNENNVLIGWSIGGYIPNGIDVPEIPKEITEADDYSKWCYSEDKGFYENPDYTPPDLLASLKEAKITESKLKLAEWLTENSMLYSDGKYYSVTAEKQSLLNSNLASYERAQAAGIPYPLKWNSTGDECTDWTYADLVSLSLAIAAYVAPKVSQQQEIELKINACETIEELNTIEIVY